MPLGMPEATEISQAEASSPSPAQAAQTTGTQNASQSDTGGDERICYVVQTGETMNAIAAKFDLTPSELARLNRIPTGSMLFPGRKLSIPVKRRKARDGTFCASGMPASSVYGTVDAASDEGSANSSRGVGVEGPSRTPSENLTQVPTGQVSVQQNNSSTDILSSLMLPPQLDEGCGGATVALSIGSTGGSTGSPTVGSIPVRARPSHVLKINARHITDGQGVVTGTLLITPNNIMFSPNVSDLIVIEHGTEHYEVTAPIDMIAGAALYTDIAIMRTKHHKPVICNIPVQVYYSETEQRPPTPPSSPNRLGTEYAQRSERGSDSGSEPVSPRPTKTPPSSPIVRGRHSEGDQTSTVRTDSRDIEEPEVFAALEKLLPKPAQPQDNGMLYLCLRMGKPLNKVVKISAVAVGRRKLKCEYWFGIPRNRVDEVYKFFQRNYPERYGDVIELDMKERGFEDIESDEESDALGGPGHGQGHQGGGDQEGTQGDYAKAPETPKSATDGALTGVLNRVGSFKNPFKLPRFFEGPNTPHPSFSSCEWEVIALKEDQASSQTSSGTCSNLLNPLTPDEILLPEMVDESEILDEEHRKMLYKEIPARAEGYAWRLVYSTTRHGFSLKTFYREMARHDGPVLLAITDTEGALFGAFVSQSIHPSDHFYGTGEMFLWSFHPGFNKYTWSGDNQYFIKGNQDSLVFGSGDGEFGLYLDGDLYHGRSAPCKTFRNEVLSKTNDFVIKSLEAWGFF
ncbi:oxidation resistance protein 1-like [Tropilaelaps mercedesae]|uniref:Oxidation resistance protein 1 n=1 Tax=Tropilaelaps mercedesae TaxID=418985 RepID=A0A1V9XYN8_9ACAR|nr:oxidation resistance protein 1-like [Tropilaelaps mercedesae]